MSELVTPNIESLVPYEGGKPVEELARELGVQNAIKLASNENALGPSPLAIEAARSALHQLHRYPDGAAYHLRERLASKLGVPMNEIIHGSGSNELIELLIRTFTTGRDHIVFGEPAFVMYKLAAIAHGTPFTAVPLREQVHDLEAMVAAVRPETRLLFVANPNNPTGTHVSKSAVERLLRETPEEVIVVMDEAYFEYTDAPDFPDCLQLRRLRERLVVLRTFSKIYGLAALRVGYGVAPAQLINYINRLRPPFNVGVLGQVAAARALDDDAHIESSRRINASERANLRQSLSELGLSVAPSQTNFLYVELDRLARPVYDALLRRGVIVRPFAALPQALRITLGNPAENQRLVTSLREVLQ